MTPDALRRRARMPYRLPMLLGGVSFGALALGSAEAAAPPPPAAPVEEVLITGSLIAGAPAIGVPVTSLGAEDLKETVPFSLYQLAQTIPSIEARMSDSPSTGGTRHFQGNLSIHGQGSQETLLMINGIRYPLQGYDLDNVDPSFIPQLALARFEVLSAGASATYGADALAGVINVILRRGFDGAITNFRYGTAPDAGGATQITASQLYGTSWDGGNVTITYEASWTSRVQGGALPWYTQDFRPQGLLDRTRLSSSNPGIVTTGAPAAAPGVTVPAGFSPNWGDIFCDNCYSIPEGTGWNFGQRPEGPTTTWTQLLGNKGVKNLRNPWADGWVRPMKQNQMAVITFDQDIIDDLFGLGPVAVFVDGFYANRRNKQNYPPDLGQARDLLTPAAGVTVPTNNPYRPTGAPATIRIHYSLGLEDEVIITGGDISGRYVLGLNFNELPFGWNGSASYAVTEDHSYGHDLQAISPNHFRAALGQTIASIAANGTTPGMAAYTKPANVPYLNVFCDATVYQCNSPITINYLRGYRAQNVRSKLNQYDLKLQGPLYELPGGEIQTAVALQRLTRSQVYTQDQTDMSFSTAIVQHLEDKVYETFNAAIGEINVPLVGGDFTLPLVQALTVVGGYRYDKYNDLEEGVWTPKLAANWDVGWGLTFRGNWGKAFRTPKGSENNPTFSTVTAANALGGDPNQSDTFLLNCASVRGSPNNQAIPGSLTAELNPTCSTAQALRAPGVIIVGGAASGAATILRAYPGFQGSATPLKPQSIVQWNVGFHFQPTDDVLDGWLTGLSLDATMFKLEYRDIITGGGIGEGPNDPTSRNRYTVAPCPALPNSDPCNAEFAALVRDISTVTTRNQRAPAPAFWDNIKIIAGDFTTNRGKSQLSGIDFDGRWDFDVLDWGTFNVGAAGYYELDQRSQDVEGGPWTETYKGVRHSGARLKRVRYRAGWTDGVWNIVTFFNYRGHNPLHDPGLIMLPPCYYAPQYGPGACYPGSPYYGPYDEGFFPMFSKATVLVDLAISYNTGEMAVNPWLRNISFDLSITNLLNKDPPWGLNAEAAQLRNIQAYDRTYTDLTRQISFSITKVW